MWQDHKFYKHLNQFCLMGGQKCIAVNQKGMCCIFNKIKWDHCITDGSAITGSYNCNWKINTNESHSLRTFTAVSRGSCTYFSSVSGSKTHHHRHHFSLALSLPLHPYYSIQSVTQRWSPVRVSGEYWSRYLNWKISVWSLRWHHVGI